MGKTLKAFSTHDIIRWLIYAMVILVPVVYHTEFSSAFTMPKLTVVRVITLLIVLVWGVQTLAQKKLSYRSSPLNKWLIGNAVVLGLTTLFSTYFWVSFFGDQGRFLGLMTMLNLLFLMFVVMTFFQSKYEIRRFIRISVWTAVALAIYGLLQFKGVVGAESWDHDPTLRVFGTMGHSNHFGAYLAFHVMLLAGLFVNAKRPAHRVLYVLAVLPMLATILATASRGAFFALVGAAFLFFIAWLYHKRQWIWKQRKRVITGVIAALILVTIFHKPIIDRFTHLSLTQRTISTIEYMQQGNVPDRVSWWFSSLAMFRDKPILGHGLSTFQDVYNPYRRLDYRVPGDVQDTVTPETAHMEYFNVLATQGIVGLFFYLGLILCWARLLFRVMRNKEDASLIRKFTALSLLTAGLVYFIQVLMSFGVIGTLVPLYLLMGASASYYHITTDAKSQTEQFKSIKLAGWETFIGTIVLLMFFFFSGWFTYRQASAEWHFEKADKLYQQKEVGQMIESYQKATHKMPWVYAYWEQLGEKAFEFGTYNNEMEIIEYLFETSISAYQRAYGLVQTQPYIQANLGLAYVVYAEVKESQGNLTESNELREMGETFYREAVTIGVNNPTYAYHLGELMMAVEREADAKEAFNHILTFREPHKEVYYYLALIETNAGQYDAARGWIQKALEQDAGNEKVKALLQRINAEAEEESV